MLGNRKKNSDVDETFRNYPLQFQKRKKVERNKTIWKEELLDSTWQITCFFLQSEKKNLSTGKTSKRLSKKKKINKK